MRVQAAALLAAIVCRVGADPADEGIVHKVLHPFGPAKNETKPAYADVAAAPTSPTVAPGVVTITKVAPAPLAGAAPAVAKPLRTYVDAAPGVSTGKAKALPRGPPPGGKVAAKAAPARSMAAGETTPAGTAKTATHKGGAKVKVTPQAVKASLEPAKAKFVNERQGVLVPVAPEDEEGGEEEEEEEGEAAFIAAGVEPNPTEQEMAKAAFDAQNEILDELLDKVKRQQARYTHLALQANGQTMEDVVGGYSGTSYLEIDHNSIGYIGQDNAVAEGVGKATGSKPLSEMEFAKLPARGGPIDLHTVQTGTPSAVEVISHTRRRLPSSTGVEEVDTWSVSRQQAAQERRVNGGDDDVFRTQQILDTAQKEGEGSPVAESVVSRVRRQHVRTSPDSTDDLRNGVITSAEVLKGDGDVPPGVEDMLVDGPPAAALKEREQSGFDGETATVQDLANLQLRGMEDAVTAAGQGDELGGKEFLDVRQLPSGEPPFGPVTIADTPPEPPTTA